MSEFKGTNYYKKNCEENYITTPISVLRYTTELENERKEMLEMLDNVYSYFEDNQEKVGTPDIMYQIEELIKKATEL